MATFRPTKRSTPTSRSSACAARCRPRARRGADRATSSAATAGSDASASTDDEKAVLSHWDSDNALDATACRPHYPPPSVAAAAHTVPGRGWCFEHGPNVRKTRAHPKLLKRLKSVVDATDCRIVLSTAWRMAERERRVLLDALIEHGINPNVVVGRTPVLGLADLHWSGDHGTPRRQGEPRRSCAT